MLMHRAGLKASNLSRDSGLSVNHTARIVSGETRNPSPDSLAALARALGVPLAALRDGGYPGADIEAQPCALSALAEYLPAAVRGTFEWRGADAHLAAARLIEPVPLIGGRAGDLALIAKGEVPIAGDLVAIEKAPDLVGFRLLSPPHLLAMTRDGRPWSEVMGHANQPIGKLAGLYRIFPKFEQSFP
jgi:transcriptional regulator with XRE-family HTH domain